MLTEQLYAKINECLKAINGSGIDSIAKLRLECLFIRLKRQIISASIHCQGDSPPVTAEDLERLQKLSGGIGGAVNRNKAVADLEAQIAAIAVALSGSDITGQ